MSSIFRIFKNKAEYSSALSPLYSREQRARQTCPHVHLATAARVKHLDACIGVFDLFNYKLPSLHITVGADRHSVQFHLKMKVRSGRLSGTSDIANLLSLLNILSC